MTAHRTKEWNDTVLCNSGDIMLHKNPNQGSALFPGLPETTFIGPLKSPTIGLCDTISGHGIRERLHIKDYLHYAAFIYFTGRDAWINTNSVWSRQMTGNDCSSKTASGCYKIIISTCYSATKVLLLLILQQLLHPLQIVLLLPNPLLSS